MSASKKTKFDSWTDKVNSTSLKLTNKCYDMALAELGFSRDSMPGALREHREKIGMIYRKFVRGLPTNHLETIIQENLDDVVRRDDSTIEEILSELANRILIEGEDETYIELAN